MKPFSLSKNERLKRKKDIDTLFHLGKAFFVYPYSITYQVFSSCQSATPLLFGVSVSKRNFKRAVDRNLIKRRVKAGFRLQKTELIRFLKEHQLGLHMMVVYTDKEIPTYDKLFKSMKQVLQALPERCVQKKLKTDN